jgi:hypothetical protein
LGQLAFSSAPDFSRVGTGDISTLKRFNGFLRKTVKYHSSINALKCGANEIFKLTHYPFTEFIDYFSDP